MAVQTPPKSTDYPTAKRLLRVPVAGKKRHKLLVVLGMLEDEGRLAGFVSMDELGERTGFPPRRVSALVSALEEDGLVTVLWTRKRFHNRFELRV